ncbi:HID1 [Auxenochlorella protothecoides x Auxenochlorella symbiontica]
MLPSSAAVRETYLGPTGIFSLPPRTLRPSLLIDSSTIDPLTSRDLAAAAARTTLHPDAVEGAAGAPSTAPAMLDAPVSGGVGGAAAGTLTFMVGGPAEAVARAQGLLGTMGRATVHCGEAGAGQAAKLCNNLVLGVSMAGVAEGLALGQRLGLDARNLTKIFNGSSARCWSADTYNPVPGVMEGVPASREYTGGFAAALMSKDLGLAQEAAAQCSAALPMTAAAAELYRQLATEAGPAIDFSGVYQHVYGGQAVAANS